MTDQKLVDEIERALADEVYDGGFGYMGDEQLTAYVRTLAVTAAEVSEKVATQARAEVLSAMRNEINHAYFNGHVLTGQGVAPGETVPAVRASYLEAVIDRFNSAGAGERSE